MSQDDQRRRRADAEALLRRPSWTSEEIDHAVAVHDLLLSPDLPPDPVTVTLRKRLAGELRRRSGSDVDRLRAMLFSLPLLDAPDPFERRLRALHYLGLTSFIGFQSGAFGLLDRSVSLLLDLDRAVRDGGAAARTLLGSAYDVALFQLAAACLVRFDGRRELLLLDETPGEEAPSSWPTWTGRPMPPSGRPVRRHPSARRGDRDARGLPQAALPARRPVPGGPRHDRRRRFPAPRGGRANRGRERTR